jgi:HEPN domain-containing protein
MKEKYNTIQRWIEKADHDLGAAEVTYLYIPKCRDIITFHCQQAVEKYLKSYLLFLDIPLKRTHNLTFLLGLISKKENVANEIYDKAAELEDFAVEIRYPDTIIELTDQDIARAIQIAKEFRKYIITKMDLDLEYEEIKK